MSRGRLKENPTIGLPLPRPDNGRTRFASPQEAATLLAAVPAGDRAIWGTAFSAGLRVGELQALAVEEVLLEDGCSTFSTDGIAARGSGDQGQEQ